MQTKMFSWKPSLDSLVAITTVLLLWLSFFIMYHTDSLLVKVLVFGLFANVIICVGIPVIFTLLFRKETLGEMGITKINLVPSLVIGIGLSLGDIQELMPFLNNENIVPQYLFNLLLFWEPFFIFGWLLPRFKKDFGLIPAIILSGISFGIYHLGSFPMKKIFEFFITGMVFSAVYSVFNNIFVMWPLFWSVGATIGTINGKMDFDWSFVAFNSILLLLQVGIIFYSVKKQKKRAQKNSGTNT